jgi:hypothetical protein
MPATSSSIKVDFYNGPLKNTDFFAQLSDNRTDITCSLSGNLNNVRTVSLFIDSYEQTSANKKTFSIPPTSSTTIGKGTTRYQYDYVDKQAYSIKIVAALNDGTTLVGKFSYGNVPDITAYKYIFRENPDTFQSAVFSNPNDVETGSPIQVDAPMAFLTGADAGKDIRRPIKVRAYFDALDQVSSADDNSELTNAYSSEVDFLDNGNYDFLSNTLTNGHSYSCTLEATYEDGHKTYVNVAGSVSVFKALTITDVEAYGMGIDGIDSGHPYISSVMDVTVETANTEIFTGDSTIVFKLSQDITDHYSFTVPAQSGANSVYNILNNGAGFIDLGGVPIRSTAANGTEYYQFNVTAYRTYTSIYPIGQTPKTTITKVSNVFSAKFALDVNSLNAVYLNNQWTALGLVAPSRKVELDSLLTQDKWDLISENGFVAKFPKNSFFGNGVASGELFEDKDNSSTQFKIESSSDSGVTFTPVTSLRMKQGFAISSATVDRAEWMSLLDDTPFQNNDGLYNNLPWSSALLGPQQPHIYVVGDSVAPSPTPIPGIFSLNDHRTKYTDAQMIGVKADSTLTVATIQDKDGWLIKNGANYDTVVNGVTKTVAPKVNLYYYSNSVPGYTPATANNPSAPSQQTDADSFTLNQATGLGLYAVYNQNAGAKQFPFFIVYTTPTGSDDKASWYKSNVFYAPASGSPLNSGLTLAYSGTDDSSFHPEIPAERRVKYEVNPGTSKANADYASEFVRFITLQTSGNALSTAPGDFDFRLLETGMFTSHASTGLVSLRYNEYSRLVVAVSIVAPASTTPARTESNPLRLMNKVNTPAAGESAIYSIDSDTITVTVTNSDQYDRMTGVVFTSNLVSPNNSVVVPKPANATSNSFTFNRANINKQSLSSSSDTACKFRIAYNVTDDNGGGSDITGLLGPEIVLSLPNSPTKANYVITSIERKTRNDDSVSEFSCDVDFNNTNDASIRGLRVYFETQNIEKTFVQNILNDSSSAVQVDITLSNKSFYNTWQDLSEGVLLFVPIYENYQSDGTVVTVEVLSELKQYGIYKVEPIPSTPVNLTGGISEADTTVNWTGTPGSTFDLRIQNNTSGFSGNASSSVRVADTDSTSFSYSLPANSVGFAQPGDAIGYTLKKKHTLPEVAAATSGLKTITTTFANYTGIEPLIHDKKSSTASFIPPSTLTVTSLTVNVGKGQGDNTITVYKTTGEGVTAQSPVIYTNTTWSFAQNIENIVVPLPPLFTLTQGEQLYITYISDNTFAMRSISVSSLPFSLTYESIVPAPVYYGVPALTVYGPQTTIQHTMVSVNIFTMTVTVKNGSNDKQLRDSFTPATFSHASLTHVTAQQLCNNSQPLPLISGISSTQLVQAPNVDNLYDLSGYQLGALLHLEMVIQAGIGYTSKVGSNNTTNEISGSVALLGIPRPYRIAGKPTVTANSVLYTVQDGKILISLFVNSNGSWVEGVTSITVIAAQGNDFTDVSAGAGGGTILATLTPSSTIKTYVVGANASASVATDYLAPGETLSVPPENVSDGFNAHETGDVTITLGSLRLDDVSVLSLPASGFNTTQPISCIVIVANRLGSGLAQFVASPPP